MDANSWARELLFGESIKSKTTAANKINLNSNEMTRDFSVPNVPGREKILRPSEKKIKFPKKGSLHLDDRKALAMHFFANHELLAIEMLAAAILKFPMEKKVLSGIVATIKDEQKHLRLYIARMNELGIEFGDYPLNSFFWDKMQKVKSLSEFYAMMALTFEQANLDFASDYMNVFQSFDDTTSANIMRTVLEDEITHVSLGYKYLDSWKKDKSVWDYYVENLPEFITPARGKGIIFDRVAREKAGLECDFIHRMESFSDNYNITKRKEW